MTIEQEIKRYVRSNGRSTTSEIARTTGHTTREVRQAAKEMMDDGALEGAKSKQIPAVIINDNYVVLTRSRQQLLSIVKTYAPSHHSRAKSMSTEDLLDFVRDTVADRVVGGPDIWEFWL